jgi:Protein of unknown function (DUF4236)
MGFRFSKRIGLGIARLNIGKRGVSISTGVRGFRVNLGQKGVRTTTSIPGTGISYTHRNRGPTGGEYALIREAVTGIFIAAAIIAFIYACLLL